MEKSTKIRYEGLIRLYLNPFGEHLTLLKLKYLVDRQYRTYQEQYRKSDENKIGDFTDGLPDLISAKNELISPYHKK